MFNLYQKITDKTVVSDIGYIENEALYYKNNDKIDGLKKIPTDIYNARYHNLNLLENGFCLLADDSGLYSLKNEDDVFSYFETLKKILKRKIGAKEVHFFSYCFRSQEAGRHTLGTSSSEPRKPVAILHGDLSLDRLQDLKKGKKTDYFNYPINLDKINVNNPNKRWLVLTIWKPLVPIINAPLAVCDKSSINPDSLFNATLHRDNVPTRQIFSTKYNKSLKFYIYPLMIPNELLVMSQYDSLDGDRITPALHSSIELCDDTKLVGQTRRNIELRCVIEL
ncbi:CmcJ/NvfI family oxidoreductase [Francisella sp. SYW-9]|uniref:CmcJ/NvfI family oxidoreductase n=1 Tax=Francisella sp. SYW-9 TaxID=2610888 RepID=UPI00123DAFB2|nr:CmcJ/NvfI family oxidoreductase [Francisella sp. SYW-9]